MKLKFDPLPLNDPPDTSDPPSTSIKPIDVGTDSCLAKWLKIAKCRKKPVKWDKWDKEQVEK